MFSLDTFHYVLPYFPLITVAVHLLGPHILQINLYCNAVSICSSLLVRHQDPNSHKIPIVCLILPVYVLPRWWGSPYCICSSFAKCSLLLVRNQGSDTKYLRYMFFLQNMFLTPGETVKFRLIYKLPLMCVIPTVYGLLSLNVLCFWWETKTQTHTKYLRYMFFLQNMFLTPGETARFRPS